MFQCGSKNEVTDVLQQMMDREVIIPNDLMPKIYNHTQPDSTLLQSSVKMIVYLDKQGCQGCKLLDLLSFNSFINELQIFKKVGIVVLLHPSQFDATDYFLGQIRYNHTVFYDLDGSFERLNPHLPKNERFHTFLLDENNRIILIGNPIGNPKLKKLYLAVLNKHLP